MEQKLIAELDLDGQKILGENNKGIDLKVGEQVVVFIDNSYSIATIISEEKMMDKNNKKIFNIIRKVSAQDLQRLKDNKISEQEVLKTLSSKVHNYELSIKIVSVKYSFDKSKLFVYYTSDSHVDFRNFVKEMAHKLKTRIQMIQIGPRDETKLLGGIGVCGNILCCKRWLKKFESISVEMAKTQQLSLNIPKLSGVCNRLKCCLSYELDFYNECIKKMPKLGTKVKTPDGEGKVVSLDCIKESVSVSIPLDEGESVTKNFPVSQIEFSLVNKLKQTVGLDKKYSSKKLK